MAVSSREYSEKNKEKRVYRFFFRDAFFRAGFLFAAFFGLGAAAAGYQLSSQNIVLEFGHRDDMAMRLALSNTAESVMSTVGPLAGGVIAASLGYAAVFWTSVAFLAIALVLLIFRVKEPRRRD